MTAKNFRVRNGLEVGDAVSVDAATGNIDTTGDIVIDGTLQTDDGTTGEVTIGGSSQGRIEIGQYNRATSGTPYIDFHSSASNADYDVRLAASGGNSTAGSGTLTVTAATLSHSGDLTVGGNLTVNGTTTTVNSTTLTVDDKNIELGSVSSPTDTTADGGGITLKGTTDKTIIYDKVNERWQTNIGLAIANGSTVNAYIDSASGNFISEGGVSVDGTVTAVTSVSSPIITNTAGALSITSSSDGNITLTPNGTGDVVLSADTVKVGDSNATATITTNGTGNLVLNTNNGTNSGTITIAQGSNGNITLEPHGTGDVLLSADTIQIGDSAATATITTNGAGNLVLNTNNGTNAGNITLANGANGNITITPNGTGDVAISASNGGNLTNNRNYVFGAIRNSTTDTAGNIWYSNASASTGPAQGISMDNSTTTTIVPAVVNRTYSNTSTTRGRTIYEKARFTTTPASPAALQSGDYIGDITFTGYSSTGWVNDNLAVSPGLMLMTTAEGWTSNTNLGTNFLMVQAPTATTINSTADLVTTLGINPQASTQRSDAFGFMQGKTVGFTATGCSISGTTLTIGTVTAGAVAAGQIIQNSTSSLSAGLYIVSGSGSTWTLNFSPGTLSAQTITGWAGFMTNTTTATTVLNDFRVFKNAINNSANTTQVALSSDRSTLTLTGDAFTVKKSTGGSNTLTIDSDGRFTILDPANNLNKLQLDNPTSNIADDNLTLSLNLANSNGAGANTEYPVFNFGNYRYSGGNYSPTQSGDVLGGFKYNGQYSSTSSLSIGSPTVISCQAVENWTSTAQGSSFAVSINKLGTNSNITAMNLASAASTFKSDSYTFQDSSGTNVVGSSKINYNRVYGQWQYDATITPAGANTAYAFPFQGTNAVTDFANIASAASTSRIIPGAAGTYRLAFSLQLENTDNAAEHVAYIWWRKNGVDISNSMGRIYVGKQLSVIAAWDNMVQTSNATDYFELMYAVDNVALIFPFYASTAFGPATASVFLNLVPVGA